MGSAKSTPGVEAAPDGCLGGQWYGTTMVGWWVGGWRTNDEKHFEGH